MNNTPGQTNADKLLREILRWLNQECPGSQFYRYNDTIYRKKVTGHTKTGKELRKRSVLISLSPEEKWKPKRKKAENPPPVEAEVTEEEQVTEVTPEAPPPKRQQGRQRRAVRKQVSR